MRNQVSGGRNSQSVHEFGAGAFQRSSELSGPVEPSRECDHANGHYAVVYETDEEQFAATVPFMREGLEQNECCIFVVDGSTRKADVLQALRNSGIDVDTALETSQLAFYTPEETYLRQEPFDPDEMISFYETKIDEAVDGFEGLRLAAGTSWIDQVSLDVFMEYEGRVNKLFDERNARALCCYDRADLPAEVICNVVHTHPHVIYDEQICHNFYYVPSDEYLCDSGAATDTDLMLRTLRDRSRAKTELIAQNQFLQRLNAVTTDPDRSFEEKLQALFELGCERFDLELGGLNRVDPETDWFKNEHLSGEHEYFEPGKEGPLSETFCSAPVEVMDTISVSDPVEEEFGDIAVYEEWGARAYLGTHISIDGGEDRTFAFIDSEPRDEPFTEADHTLIELMANWVKVTLERKQRKRELERSNDQLAAINNLYRVVHDINQGLAIQSSRDEIEQVVCEQLVASDSYKFAWIWTNEDAEGSISVSAADPGYPDQLVSTVEERATEQGVYRRSVRTGDTQIVRGITGDSQRESGREAAPWHDSAALAAIPITYEERQYGVLSIYTTRDRAFNDEERHVVDQLGEIIGLAVAATEHERELEYERERLEFFNRLIRHNLLNSLNLVQARAGILDDYVDASAQHHLDLVRNRTDDMIDLIETLRSLMRAVVGRDEPDLEPVDVGEVLRSEIRKADQTHSQAELTVDGRLDDAGQVIANDLLAEAVENVLANAVQHNDRTVQEITVSVEQGNETTTITIADNGPGIPDEDKEQIFQKGEKRFESPGSGFGLYLVREIVDAYDGEIEVTDNEPEGTVFAVSLPRPND